MHYLCNKFNITIVVYTASVREMIYVEDGKIKGSIGKYSQRSIASGRSQPFLCKLIGEENTGFKLENSSHTGAIGMLERGIADLFLKTTNPLIDSEFVTPMGGVCNQK